VSGGRPGRLGAVARAAAAAVLAAAALAAAPAARAETLADVLIAAYEHSNLLEQNRALLRAADEDVAVAVSALRPVVAFAADVAYSNQAFDDLQATIGLQAELTLLDFGRSALAVEAAKETVLATREALIEVEQQVLLAAVSAYVGVLLNQEIVALRQSNERLILQELRAAEDRFELGDTTRTDVALAEARLAAARSALVQAQGDLLVARENFKLAVGRFPGRLAPLPPLPRTAATIAEARGIAERTHPLVRQAQRAVTVAELGVGRAEAATRPTVGLRGSLGVSDDGDRAEALALEFNQTLYAGGRLSALYRQALAGRDRSRAALHQAVAEAQQRVGEAWANVAVAVASIEAAEREIRATRTAFEGVREEAALGARTTLDVLDAEQDFLTARTNRVSAEASRYVETYRLLAAMGLLTVEHLRLGIPTYDPAAYYNAVKDAPATSTQGRRLDRVLEAIGRD
jgi:outer membrane protein